MFHLIKEKSQDICHSLERLREFLCLDFFVCLFGEFSLPIKKKKKEKKVENHISVSVEMGFNLLPPNDHL